MIKFNGVVYDCVDDYTLGVFLPTGATIPAPSLTGRAAFDHVGTAMSEHGEHFAIYKSRVNGELCWGALWRPSPLYGRLIRSRNQKANLNEAHTNYTKDKP